jgi:Raf kinase inhibitor-like YbhB/YbcL family protein
MALQSPAFRAGGDIPRRFTCDGRNVSPPLRWSAVPARARELALLVEDPDAGNFVHWSLLALPRGTRAVAEGRVPASAVQAKNGFGRAGWGGPCPPKGSIHDYAFTLYALRRPLGLGPGASPKKASSAIRAAAIAKGTLTGRYGRR